jgi:hypothetical protein
VIATTPNNASAATIAITANVVLLFISKMSKVGYRLRISASKLQDKIICWNIANNSTRILKVLKEALRRLDSWGQRNGKLESIARVNVVITRLIKMHCVRFEPTTSAMPT